MKISATAYATFVAASVMKAGSCRIFGEGESN
jgi:hypothetical protein